MNNNVSACVFFLSQPATSFLLIEVISFESWCVYRRGSCDSQSWFVYREGKWWFSYATKCGEFLNLYIWGHKAIICFYQLKSLFFPQHASVLVIKKKCVFSLSAYNFFDAKLWFLIMSCYLLLFIVSEKTLTHGLSAWEKIVIYFCSKSVV